MQTNLIGKKCHYNKRIDIDGGREMVIDGDGEIAACEMDDHNSFIFLILKPDNNFISMHSLYVRLVEELK